MQIPLLLLLLSVLAQGALGSEEDQLVARLLEQLQPAGAIARPVSDAKASASLTLGLSLIRIESVSDGSVELEAWAKMLWNDPRLKWNRTEFGNLKRVALPSKLVWVPDIRPYNAMGYRPEKESSIQVVVTHDGSVIYVLPIRMRATQCVEHKRKSITCIMKLGSWVYSGTQVDLQMSKGKEAFDISEFMEDKWTVENSEVRRKSTVYPCCPEPYISIEYKFTLKQKRRDSNWLRKLWPN